MRRGDTRRRTMRAANSAVLPHRLPLHVVRAQLFPERHVDPLRDRILVVSWDRKGVCLGFTFDQKACLICIKAGMSNDSTSAPGIPVCGRR